MNFANHTFTQFNVLIGEAFTESGRREGKNVILQLDLRELVDAVLDRSGVRAGRFGTQKLHELKGGVQPCS